MFDPIDALAVARAALREPDLPMAQLDGPAQELRLLVDRREDLVKHRQGLHKRLDAAFDGLRRVERPQHHGTTNHR
jgi:hypothetical protein